MKKENTSSFVKKINGRLQAASLWRLFFTDFLILVSGTVCWCLAKEDTEGKISLFQQRVLLSGERLKDLSYGFTASGGTPGQVNVGRCAVVLLWVLGILLVLQLLVWFDRWDKNENYLRNVLRPIDEVAIAADRIAALGMEQEQEICRSESEGTSESRENNQEPVSVTGIDADRIHSMENAINSIHGSGEGIHIGDRDLQGLEDSINNLLERLRISTEEQIRFVDDASHELRTPISVINGYASMLCRWGKDDPGTLEEGLRAILEESRHMQTLVEQLLFLARGDGGRQQLKFKVLEPDVLMEEIRQESELIDDKHIYAFEGSAPAVNADEAMLKQALRILVENAAKYTPDGEQITLYTGSEGEEVLFGVKDHGIGLDKNESAHMFERFFRGERARGSTRGSGLGLSIAAWIVKRHGGTIEAVGFKDVGTKVTIRLKRA